MKPHKIEELSVSFNIVHSNWNQSFLDIHLGKAKVGTIHMFGLPVPPLQSAGWCEALSATSRMSESLGPKGNSNIGHVFFKKKDI